MSQSSLRTCFRFLLFIVATLGMIAQADAQARKSTVEPRQRRPAAIRNSVSVDGLHADTDTDVNAIAKYESSVRSLLYEQKFTELDNLAAENRKSKLKFKGGVWKLYTMYQGLKQPVGARSAVDSEWDKHMTSLATWASSRPASDTARIALAQASLIYAMKAMLTHADSEQKANELRTRKEGSLHLAELMLSEASMMGTRCPHWYFVTLELQERRNTGRAEAIFEEAIAKEPTYYAYYRLHGLYQRQEWNADEGEAERFAQNMADQAGGKEGDIVYFEIASAMDVSPNVRLFPIADLSWERVTRGYSALQEKYGFSLQKLNQFAYLAMRARKIEQAAELFSKIGNNWDKDTWGSEKLFAYSKAYAVAPQDIVSLRSQTGLYETPQGQKYGDQVKHDLFPQLSESLQRCVERKPNEPYAGFEWFIQVNGDGAVQSARIWPENKFNTCMSAGLHSSGLKVSAPGNGQQWVRIGDFPSPPLLDE